MNAEAVRRSSDELGVTVALSCESKLPHLQNGTRVLHEEIEIKYFYEGSSTLLIGERAVSVRAGDVVVINPYEFHTTVETGAQNEGGVGKYHLLMVPLDYFSKRGESDLQLQSLLLSGNRSFQTLFAQHGELSHSVEQIALEYTEKNFAYKARIGALLTEIFVLLLRDGMNESAEPLSDRNRLRRYRLIEPALRYIRDCYAEPITVDCLSALCNLSKHYFCHVFKELMQRSTMEYLQLHRLKIADIMLRNTERPVCEIAEACGFESAAYFCRLYKKRYGISPGKRR